VASDRDDPSRAAASGNQSERPSQNIRCLPDRTGDGEVVHEVIRPGTVPVLFTVWSEHDTAGIQFDDLLTSYLFEASAF
jgi:hypothetical protein